MRRRLRDKNFPASSASTKPSSVSGSIVALPRTNTGFGSWSTILVSENCRVTSVYSTVSCNDTLLLYFSERSGMVRLQHYQVHGEKQWRKRTIGHGRTNPKSVAFSKPQE